MNRTCLSQWQTKSQSGEWSGAWSPINCQRSVGNCQVPRESNCSNNVIPAIKLLQWNNTSLGNFGPHK